jgi:hypothetical protein
MLKSVEPEILWDDAGHRPKLETEADWIRAGELVYDSPIFVMPVAKLGRLLSREQLRRVQAPVDRDGRLPVNRYAVRIKGEIELGWSSCADCHTRVLPDGTWVKGTQGNFPNAKLAGFGTRIGLNGTEAEIRESAQAYYGTPWHVDGPNARLRDMTLDGFVQSMEACPPGVYPNHNGSYWSPAHAAELRGIKDRRYLDATGHMRHRGPGDLMRFIDFHQSGSIYASFGEYHPQTIPPPEEEPRYSDEQAYALALFLYSLKAPPNPNLPTTPEQIEQVERGRKIFMDSENRCATCHDPKRGYTNNKLTPVDGFTVPEDHPEKEHIMPRSVHTDPTFALKTRKGTGFYKVPTLLGLWHRGPFEHNGSVATLEDWFDERRLRDDYVPTGWKGPPGTTTRPVKGHAFGLDLSEQEKKALMAFLKTL